MSKQIITVWVTGAASPIGQAFIPMLANGEVFGNDQPININLLDINVPVIINSLQAIKLEL